MSDKTTHKYRFAFLSISLLIIFTGLTPTEQYIVNFFDKLKADTIADKLDWNIESADYLNRLETDMSLSTSCISCRHTDAAGIGSVSATSGFLPTRKSMDTLK